MFRQKYAFITVWLIAAMLIGACAAPAAAPAAETGGDAAPAAAEESSAAPVAAEGGILNFAYSQNPRNLNPLDSVQGVQSQLFRMIYNRLLQYDIGFFGSPPQPSLAESYEVSEDGLTFTFHLRPDVVWHDGEPFTAEDVAFTFTAAVHPDNPTFWGPSLSTLKGLTAFQNGTADSIEGLNVVDEQTIQITLESPSMSFLDTLAFVGILPKHILGDVPAAELAENEFFSKSPIGTGPFKVVEVVEDQYIRLERNEDYFLGSPKLAGINFFYPDSTTVAAGFETGEIDLSSSLPTEDVERFLNNPDFNVVFQPSSVFCNVTANVERIPKDVRHAIQFAIDRDTITDELFMDSQLSIPFYHHLGQDFLQPNPYEKEIYYDPDMARELVQSAIDAGEWDADHVLDFIFNGEEPSEEILFIQQFLADVGLNSAFRGVGDRAAFNQTYLEEHDFDIVSGCNAYGPEPDSVNIYYKCGYGAEEGGYNASLFCNERADELLEAGRAETDIEQRIPIYQELQGILDDEAAIIPIRLSVTKWVMTSRLKDATPQYYGHLTNYDAIEKWYLEE
ncbi:MAG TPA: ABC transporter substrate-binding protein [Caldilineaceae bacterium]|nr:ABC transporter substrate-binding protein [Caldilineaceae bacterium]